MERPESGKNNPTNPDRPRPIGAKTKPTHIPRQRTSRTDKQKTDKNTPVIKKQDPSPGKQGLAWPGDKTRRTSRETYVDP